MLQRRITLEFFLNIKSDQTQKCIQKLKNIEFRQLMFN